jgi:predicted permease
MYVADRWVEAFFEKAGYVGIAVFLFYTLVILFIGILIGAALNDRPEQKRSVSLQLFC